MGSVQSSSKKCRMAQMRRINSSARWKRKLLIDKHFKRLETCDVGPKPVGILATFKDYESTEDLCSRERFNKVYSDLITNYPDTVSVAWVWIDSSFCVQTAHVHDFTNYELFYEMFKLTELSVDNKIVFLSYNFDVPQDHVICTLTSVQ